MLVVQKYGGTSVADSKKIKNIAGKIVDAKRQGNQVLVVVSAPGETTDNLLTLANQISDNPNARELDMLLSAGERISMSLLSMAIYDLGEPAISFTGSQAGIITDGVHTKAKIVSIKCDRILDELELGKIVIVAGFQGVSQDNNVTTLGRGGSDLTAVALAAKLKADICEIYTDVNGVYTANPGIVPEALMMKQISYEEMLEMAACGSKVLQARSVELAREYGVVLHIRSSFIDLPGTIVSREEKMLESAIVSGISFDPEEAKITISGVPDKPGIAAIVFGALAEKEINVDMIIQNVSKQYHADISFTLPQTDLPEAKAVIDKLVEQLGAEGYTCDEKIAKVSIIGAGMKTHPGVAAKMFKVLADNKINILMISTSSIKVSCVVAIKEGERSVKALHKAFDLDQVVVAD